MYKYAFYNFELGILKITYTDTAVTALKRMDNIDEKNEHSSLSDIVFLQIQEYFSGKRTTFNFPYELHGTEFQKKYGVPFVKFHMGKLVHIRVSPYLLGTQKQVELLAWQTVKILLALLFLATE